MTKLVLLEILSQLPATRVRVQESDPVLSGSVLPLGRTATCHGPGGTDLHAGFAGKPVTVGKQEHHQIGDRL